jgi:hypothetical protein
MNDESRITFKKIAFLIIQRDHSFVLLAETILLLGQIN